PTISTRTGDDCPVSPDVRVCHRPQLINETSNETTGPPGARPSAARTRVLHVAGSVWLIAGWRARSSTVLVADGTGWGGAHAARWYRSTARGAKTATMPAHQMMASTACAAVGPPSSNGRTVLTVAVRGWWSA